MKSKRTRFDLNEVVIFNSHAEIVLYDIHQDEKARTIIDVEDVSKVANYRWSLTKYGYVRGKLKGGKDIFIHRLIMNPPKGRFVDHIDMNKLNNVKTNLRIVGKAENGMNRLIPSNSTSGVKGVSFDSRRCKYRAVIKVNQKQIWLGYHNTLIDAEAARHAAERKYFGEFSSLL